MHTLHDRAGALASPYIKENSSVKNSLDSNHQVPIYSANMHG